MFRTTMLATTAMFALVALNPAQAVVINFHDRSTGLNSGTLVYPEATFTSSTGTMYVGAAGIDHEICPLTAGFNCEATLNVVFTSAASGLSFVTSGYDSAATVSYTGLSTNGAFSGSFAGSNGLLTDFSGFGGILSFSIRSNDPAGIAYDDFTFDQKGAVPEPASWALMLVGFGAIGGALRSRKAAVSFA